MNWIDAVFTLQADDEPFVIVTVLAVKGSAPRDAETKMIVSRDKIFDSIGGGSLEFKAIEKSRELIESGAAATFQSEFTLGKDLAQCCGGEVQLLFEHIPPRNFNVVVFGAGHVGTALMKIIADLPWKIFWTDSRKAETAAAEKRFKSSNIQISLMENPDAAVALSPENACYIVMTHSHALDQEIVEAVLSRGDSKFCGLIGSKSKAAKFKSRLRRKQFSEKELDRLTSPVGLEQIKGKRPMEVAVSIAGQLIQLQNADSNGAPPP